MERRRQVHPPAVRHRQSLSRAGPERAFPRSRSGNGPSGCSRAISPQADGDAAPKTASTTSLVAASQVRVCFHDQTRTERIRLKHQRHVTYVGKIIRNILYGKGPL